MENQTYPGHSILPNKPSFKPETITGPSVQPTTNQKASPQSANEVVESTMTILGGYKLIFRFGHSFSSLNLKSHY